MKFLKAALTMLALLVMVAALLGIAVQTVAAQDTGTTYVVQPGDNLFRIGLKFGIRADVLARYNGIVNPNQVVVGQRLQIPPGAIIPTPTPELLLPTIPPASGTAAATSAATSTATSAPTTEATSVTGTLPPVPTIAPVTPTAGPPPTQAAPEAPPTTYTVQPGDNLHRIALRFGTTQAVLMQLNGLANPNIIFVGQVLRLPPTVTGGSPGNVAPTSAAVSTEAVPAANNTASNVNFAFGVQVELSAQDANAVVGKVKDLGMAWVSQTISWRLLESTKGTINFPALDAQIDALTGSGAKVLLTVVSAPDWARTSPNESGPPTDYNDYANFVGALAARYKGRVQAYEVWREPNLRREWSGRPLSAASYVELLRLAYTAIKRADSDALVLSAGLAPTGFNDGVNAISDREFLRQAYAAGLGAYSDAIGVHPNGWANPPDSTCCSASPDVSGWFNDRSFYFGDTLRDYRQIMTENNDSGTFIWVTDFGWGSSEGVTEPSTVDQNFGFVNFTSQAEQAQYIPRAYEIGRTLGFVGPMFLSNLNACQVVGSTPQSVEFRLCYFSLLDKDGNPRLAYEAVKAARK